ncbi:anti-phage deoxyguanosine triphosphatase [Pseudomonadota bacterium]
MKHEEQWIARRSGKTFNRENDTRDPYARDRARVIHSASFRRLQAKTQVLGVGESDFCRTRLTHSLEVAQIGAGIIEQLRVTGAKNAAPWVTHLPSANLIEAICLAHDIGHPPFGHGGETALNFMMRSHGGFEGNGQTLRILSLLEKYTAEHGMDLTRRAMLGVIKYPQVYSKISSSEHICTSFQEADLANKRVIKVDDWVPPKGIFDADEPILDWILEPFTEGDRARFREFTISSDKTQHHQTRYKAFDTSIMDLADDIAYGVHDLEDAISLKIVNRETWEDKVLASLNSTGSTFGGQDIDTISADLFSPESHIRKSAIGGLVNWLITAIKVVENDAFGHPFLRHQATLGKEDEKALSALKHFVLEHVINRVEGQIMGYKGQQIVMELFEALASDPARLLPESQTSQWAKAQEEDKQDKAMRVICDYISGMTDDFASRMYGSLFVAGTGSIFDRV